MLPDQFEYLQYREKDNPDALQWDEIAKAKYTPWSNGTDISIIRQTEEGRIKKDSVFEQIKANTQRLAELNDKLYTLNIKKYQEEQKQIREIVRQIDKLTKTNKANPVELLPADIARFSNDEAKHERQELWLKNLKSDIYINETVSIVNNIISNNAIVRSK